MGISLSCLQYGHLYERLLRLFSNFIDFNPIKSDAHGQVPILRALGSGKMFMESSLNLKKMESDKDAIARTTSLEETAVEPTVLQPSSPKDEAATKLQKVYKSFRTRRQLADCAVLVEQRWWKLLDYALLKRSSVSFFDHERPETVVSRWSRARMRAAKVGKGLSKDEKAQKLALQHWLEAIDPRHRYGHNLHFYYLDWLRCDSKQPFFYWLDVGEGRELNLAKCSRSKLQQQCIKYLGPKERDAYEVILEDGKLIYKQSRLVLDTSQGSQDQKWIFVLSTSKLLYVGEKKKGRFQHSSFLAGGATSSAGRLVVEKGILKAVWPHSGHYRPTEENFLELMGFLRENNVDLQDVKRSPVDNEEPLLGRSSSSSRLRRTSSRQRSSKNLKSVVPDNIDKPVEVCECDVHNAEEDCLTMVNETSNVTSDGSGQVSRCINTVDVQHIYNGSEEETEKDSDDNLGPVEAVEVAASPDEASCSSFPLEISQEGHEALEGSMSPVYIFQKKNLFEEDIHECLEQPLLQRIDSIKRKNSLQLGNQWTSGVGPRIGCVRNYPSQLQFQALEQVNLSPRSMRRPSSTCSTPITTASSTPKSKEALLLKHYSLDSFYCT